MMLRERGGREEEAEEGIFASINIIMIIETAKIKVEMKHDDHMNICTYISTDISGRHDLFNPGRVSEKLRMFLKECFNK